MKWWKEEKAQSMTEFAFLLPVLLLLVCGVIDLGRVMFGYLQLNMAAQEAVRLGALGQSDAAITTFAQSYVHLGGTQTVQVTVAPADTVRKSGDYVTVTLQIQLPYITPLISSVLPLPTIEADSTQRVE